MIYVETPNYGSVYRAITRSRWMGFIPYHEILYSAKAICGLLESAGGTVVAIRTDHFMPFSYDGLRRLRVHRMAFSVLAAVHGVCVRRGWRRADVPVPTQPAALTRALNAPFGWLGNRLCRAGDQLIVVAKYPPAA